MHPTRMCHRRYFRRTVLPSQALVTDPNTKFAYLMDDDTITFSKYVIDFYVLSSGVPITQGLIDTHILRPSSYVEGQHESTDPFNSKVRTEKRLSLLLCFIFRPYLLSRQVLETVSALLRHGSRFQNTLGSHDIIKGQFSI